jgi:hypothetical protein
MFTIVLFLILKYGKNVVTFLNWWVFRLPDAHDVVVVAVVVVDEIQECSVIKIKKLCFYFFYVLINNTHI